MDNAFASGRHLDRLRLAQRLGADGGPKKLKVVYMHPKELPVALGRDADARQGHALGGSSHTPTPTRGARRPRRNGSRTTTATAMRNTKARPSSSDPAASAAADGNPKAVTEPKRPTSTATSRGERSTPVSGKRSKGVLSVSGGGRRAAGACASTSPTPTAARPAARLGWPSSSWSRSAIVGPLQRRSPVARTPGPHAVTARGVARLPCTGPIYLKLFWKSVKMSADRLGSRRRRLAYPLAYYPSRLLRDEGPESTSSCCC